MYYLLMALSVATSLALSSIASELGSKYFARYFVENEAADIGISELPETPPARPPAPVRGDAPVAVGANGGSAGEPVRIGPVTPILFASVQPAILAANLAEAARGVDRPRETGIAVPAAFVIDAPRAEPLTREASGTPGSLLAAAVPNDPAEPLPAEPPPAMTPGDAVDPAAADLPITEAGSEGEATGPQKQLILSLARDTPYRLPDGSAFLPIATQRIFSMRWQVSRQADVPMAYEIPGHIITNPGTGTLVHATLAGVVEANQGAFPYLGMTVRSGDVLAYLQPTMSVSERTQIEARIQQLVNLVSLTEKQIERLKEVLFIRYRANKIEALKVQMDGSRRELAALQNSHGRRDALRANADGVISRIDGVVGGTVGQGQVVFEIIDPRALWVEAAAYDPAIAANIGSATAVAGDGDILNLEFVGGGLVLSNQAIPLRFRVLDAPGGLSVGTPVTVIVRQDRTIAGIPVPASSVIRDGDGRSIVWERLSAERFTPRQVRVVRVAGDEVVVQSGLSDGARVVVDGATILNQVR
jgi:cobalt-zinc-cadmium efflux system membrane fusion protein